MCVCVCVCVYVSLRWSTTALFLPACTCTLYAAWILVAVGTGMFLKTCFVASPWREPRLKSVWYGVWITWNLQKRCVSTLTVKISCKHFKCLGSNWKYTTLMTAGVHGWYFVAHRSIVLEWFSNTMLYLLGLRQRFSNLQDVRRSYWPSNLWATFLTYCVHSNGLPSAPVSFLRWRWTS